ncbi:MAG: ribonuclease HII [Bacteroides sp.]|nr:ribonuclease HII [Bacteroides sp.]
MTSPLTLYPPTLLEAGCDEAGRGCLSGPVSCAAVILPPDFSCPDLNDSKQLSEKKREALRPIIEANAIAWAVIMVPPDEIDRINILNASITGMQRALDALTVRPRTILVDGNRFRPYIDPATGLEIPYRTIVKGDATYMTIAAASILAKTHRDALMRRLALDYPGYGWEHNAGYPTPAHKRALRTLGLTPHHRRTFAPCTLPSLFDLPES